MRLFAKREAYRTLVDGETVSAADGKEYWPQGQVEWGSITKLVTAHAVAVLVDEGHLEYDTPVREILGVLPATVTVRGLATHTSGLPRVHAGMGSGVFSDPYAGSDTGRVVAALSQLTQGSLLAAGTAAYSNLGYAALGLVVESVTGDGWFDSVDRLVLRPLGVRTSLLPMPDERIDVRGFDGKPHEPWSLAAGPYAAAGGIWSTLDDLAAYGQAVLDSDAIGGDIGGGIRRPERAWQVRGDVYWHNGQTRDSGSFLAVLPQRRAVVATHALARLPGTADRNGWRIVDALSTAR